MLIKSYQEQKKLEQESAEPQSAQTATIGHVYAEGVTLVWDDDGSESRKLYPVSRAVVFHAGDRVKLCRTAGTYLVEYPYGAPLAELAADTAREALHAQSAETAATAQTAQTAATATRAETAASADTAATATSAATAQTCTTATFLQSNDNTADGIRLTYNPGKRTFAIASKLYTPTWYNLATN